MDDYSEVHAHLINALAYAIRGLPKCGPVSGMHWVRLEMTVLVDANGLPRYTDIGACRDNCIENVHGRDEAARIMAEALVVLEVQNEAQKIVANGGNFQ